MPQVVPTSSVLIDGHNLLGGTIVGVNPCVLKTQTPIFGDDAAVLRPKKWSDANEGRVRLMDNYMVLWEGASRICPGQHLAMFVMTKVLVTLFDQFDVKLFMDDRVTLRAYLFDASRNHQGDLHVEINFAGMREMTSTNFGELVLQDGEYETSVNRLFRWRLSRI